MRKNTKRALKIMAGAVLCLLIASVVYFLALTRTPTTELVDSSGEALTAGNNDVGGEESATGCSTA